MPRPTKQEIDAEILDVAAGLFARHGFAHTSVQQIADAVGCSKAGLLHRFPSKEALHAAVLAGALEDVGAVRDAVADLEPGPERDRAALERIVDFALCSPGAVALLISPFGATVAEADVLAIEPVGALIFEAFATDPEADLERSVRLTTALGGLAVARLALGQDLPDGVRPLLVTATHDALGHQRPQS